ncbi:MbcA/ParS/Xre antitoxin family protein [Aquabacterium olei]|nr:MbcA/ParS/Xre antitoxin family protein [Aquabacterium olei]
MNEKAASVWMNRPHVLLGGASPREAARKSKTGATRVQEILVAIKHGGVV